MMSGHPCQVDAALSGLPLRQGPLHGHHHRPLRPDRPHVRHQGRGGQGGGRGQEDCQVYPEGPHPILFDCHRCWGRGVQEDWSKIPRLV